MNNLDVIIPFEIKDDWFNKYHVKHITQEFMDWWLGYYGVPGDYEDSGQHEYYVRMSFSLAGWRAKKETNNNAIQEK